MSAILKAYRKLLTNYPVFTQALQAGALMGGGDAICQKFVEKKDFDFIRSAKFASVGFFIAGPALRTWYGFLDTRIVGAKVSITLKKVALDQFIFAPGLIAILLSSLGALQGLSMKDNMTKLKHDYPDVLVTNYFLWPWVQLVNFRIVPLNYQVLVVQFVSLFWNSYLSWKSYSNVKQVELMNV